MELRPEEELRLRQPPPPLRPAHEPSPHRLGPGNSNTEGGGEQGRRRRRAAVGGASIRRQKGSHWARAQGGGGGGAWSRGKAGGHRRRRHMELRPEELVYCICVCVWGLYIVLYMCMWLLYCIVQNHPSKPAQGVNQTVLTVRGCKSDGFGVQGVIWTRTKVQGCKMDLFLKTF